jgi:hypothetical protein
VLSGCCPKSVESALRLPKRLLVGIAFGFVVVILLLALAYLHRPSYDQFSSDDEVYEVYSAAIRVKRHKVVRRLDCRHSDPFNRGQDREFQTKPRSVQEDIRHCVGCSHQRTAYQVAAFVGAARVSVRCRGKRRSASREG